MSQNLTDAQFRPAARLRRFAYGLTHNASAADDLVQNTLERVLRKASHKRPETQWQAWIFRILYRQFLDSQRWAKRYARLLAWFGEQLQTETDNSPEAHWMAHSTLEALGRLKPEQRALLLLVTVEGFSYQQASEALDIPLGTVMSRLSRAPNAAPIRGGFGPINCAEEASVKPVIDDLELHAYVDNQLDPESRQRLEQVLAKTPALAQEVEHLRQEQRRLRAALAGSASPLFNDPLDPKRIRHAVQQRRWQRQAQTAVFLVLLGSAVWFGGFSPTFETRLPMDDAVQAYRVFANAETVPDIRFQQATEILAWLGSRFANPPQLPNFSAQGIKPVLGRWLVTEAGPAALVLYQNAQGQPLMLYIRPPGQRMKTAGKRHDGALITHYWPDQSYHYALTGLAEAMPH